MRPLPIVVAEGKLRYEPLMGGWRIIFLGLVLLAALAFDAHNLINIAPISRGVDFGVFQRASAGPAHLVYQVHAAPFAYPPTALLLMKPLTALGYWFWIAISAAAFALSVAALSGKRVALLSFLSPAAVKGLIHGQSPMLLAALMFAGLRVPPLLGGALWGVAASVKPQLMLFAPLALLVRRDWQMLVGFVLGTLMMLTLSLLAWSPLLWPQWIEAVGHFNQLIEGGLMIRAVTPAGAAAELGLPAWPFLLSGLALAAVAVTLAAPRLEGEQLIALVVAASLAVSPYAHSYDTIALIPACAALLLRGPWWAVILAAMVFVGTPGLTMIGLMGGLAATALWAVRSAPKAGTRPSTILAGN